MKYVQNNGRYDLAFEIEKNGRPVKIEFFRRRVYMDTGNVAVQGITPVEDDDFEKLNEFTRFKKLFETKEFELTEASKIETSEKKAEALAEENVQLKKALEEANQLKPSDKAKKQLEEKEKEIAGLKAQLEALAAGKASETKDEAEGF